MIDWDLIQKKILINSSNGKALVAHVDFNKVSDIGCLKLVSVHYIEVDEFTDINFTEEDSPNLDSFVYVGEWSLDYINSLL
ncbi:hypothetical protein VPFG_00270 [Vibrio phage nt-1]|uniref:Uncharacterized protein n=1 Tax=Vibrio phage nt-1 TaxID=115992 RepID=R9TFK9_9CAUD|nr:hypothetical protein VPFG_00270 [Vibrio phage nt-1]AGN30269.1 hypothetical protein VPFG_00270 [Vibrio phage nt-1]